MFHGCHCRRCATSPHSQSDALRVIVAAFASRPDIQAAAAKHTLGALGVQFNKCRTIAANEVIASAVTTLKKFGGSLPVVAADGTLHGNFSASDVAELFNQEAPNFGQTVGEFLNSHPNKKVLQPFTVTAESTVADVCSKMADSRLHHLWCVDAANKPIACVSLGDMLMALLMVRGRRRNMTGSNLND